MRNGAGRCRGLCQCPACPAPGTGPRHVRCSGPAACCPAAPCDQRAARRPWPSGRARAPPARPPEGPPGWPGGPAGRRSPQTPSNRPGPPEDRPARSAPAPAESGSPPGPPDPSAPSARRPPRSRARRMTTPPPPGQAPVFADLSGRRRRRMQRVGAGLTAAFVSCMTVAAIGMLGGPKAPFISWAAHPRNIAAPGQAGTKGRNTLPAQRRTDPPGPALHLQCLPRHPHHRPAGRRRRHRACRRRRPRARRLQRRAAQLPLPPAVPRVSRIRRPGRRPD